MLAAAEIVWLDGEYAFEEVSSLDFAYSSATEALAIVRDGNQWSLLRKAEEQITERFCLFSCHFDANFPNSGFVGWLALEFKSRLGTGVFVTCGQNSRRGGTFDYWGLPAELRDRAVQLLQTLRERAGA